MNYQEARQYMKQAMTRGSVLGLEHMNHLMERLGNVQNRLTVLHVAGTNGKGSTSAFICEILKKAGYQVGRYSSPAVFDYLEIFQINGEMIPAEEYAKLISRLAEVITDLQNKGYEPPTAFEIETALAYLWFYEKKCDFVVMEVGMGGRLDATNIIKQPLVSILTPISMDHMAFLGNTLSEIAGNKAGIIKENCEVVTSIQEPEAMQVIKETAKQMYSNLILSGVATGEFHHEYTKLTYQASDGITYQTKMHLLGTFQLQNVATAIETILCLKRKGYAVSHSQINEGIASAIWHGRFEQIGKHPDIYFDGGHNPGAAVNIRDTIEMYFTNKKIVYIIGVLADKDYHQVLKLTAQYASQIITITPPDNPRALDGKVLAKTAREYNENVLYCESLEEAVQKGILCAGDDGVLFIYGSLSYLGKISDIIKHRTAL